MGERIRFYEEIDIGDEMKSWKSARPQRTWCVTSRWRACRAGRFTDDAYARKEGLTGAIIPGNMSLGFLSRMVTEFFPTGTLCNLTANFRVTVPHNTPLICSGVVTENRRTRAVTWCSATS